MKKIILPVIAFSAIMMTSCGESGPTEAEVETSITEIETTIRTLREFRSDKEIIVIFEPHRYWRYRLILNST